MKLTDIHGHVTEYTYYNDGRLYQVIIKRPPAADRVFTYSYDTAGRLLEIQYPGGTNLVARFTDPLDTPGSGWDANGNLLHLRYLKSNTLLQGFAFSYDDAGNRIQMVDTPSNPLNEVTWDYGYDWINRLTSVDRNTVNHSLYSYDERDNRLSWDQPVAGDLHEYSYDLADQIQDRSLNSSVVETFDHDDGNMISRTLVAGPDTTDYDRNDQDQLTRIQLPTSAEEVYRYDTDGIRKYTDNTTSYYSSGGTSVAETNPGGNVSYIQGHVLLGVDLAGTFYYYLTDGLSSVRLIVDASGNEVASFTHNEFGIPETTTGSGSLRAHTYVGGAGVRNETAFSGLYYMRQRWYDPTLGRFLRQDPVGFAGGLNWYTYVGQNPATWVDPNGLDRVKFLSGKYKGYFGGGVQFNENYVNTKIRPNFEKKGHTFSLCQGVDRFGLINSLYDNDVVYVSTHGAINANGIAGWDLGPNKTTDVVRSDDRDLPGSGGFGYSPFRAKLVIAGSCEVGQTDALAKSLGINSKSNAAFVGWDRSIDAGVSDRAIQSLFDQLLQGKTIGEAVDSVGNPNLKLYGNSNVRLEP